MGRVNTNINWDNLRDEFVLGQWPNVRSFLVEKFGKKSPQVANQSRYTNGWIEAKHELQRNLEAQRIKELYEQAVLTSEKALINTINGICAKATTIGDVKRLPMKDVKRLWEMMMIITGRPTKVVEFQDSSKELTEAKHAEALEKMRKSGLIK